MHIKILAWLRRCFLLIMGDFAAVKKILCRNSDIKAGFLNKIVSTAMYNSAIIQLIL